MLIILLLAVFNNRFVLTWQKITSTKLTTGGTHTTNVTTPIAGTFKNGSCTLKGGNAYWSCISYTYYSGTLAYRKQDGSVYDIDPCEFWVWTILRI